jgi:hypothetical protein
MCVCLLCWALYYLAVCGQDLHASLESKLFSLSGCASLCPGCYGNFWFISFVKLLHMPEGMFLSTSAVLFGCEASVSYVIVREAVFFPVLG